ncbi:Hpt domain-containing protein [Pseudoalteromonas rubra]|uniref:Hpt domain-containing protein n=1 Tax=Pseudoalteromonas rubra TaxID=43658 RepID=UPI000F7B10F0|nr:Hpt domain-containing protein [Pseudoalteromonas rubra]
MNVTIDEACLDTMQSLLGEQFSDTLVFCISEFERLEREVRESLPVDLEAATRNAHSLKSNAAQFGAMSLSDSAREVEMLLLQGDVHAAKEALGSLSQQVIGSTAKLQQWLMANA